MRVVNKPLLCRGRLTWLLGLLLLAACAGKGVYHPVRSGESLGEIARRYGQDEVALARINGIRDPGDLHSGDRIFIPEAGKVRTAPPPRPKPAPVPVRNDKPRSMITERVAGERREASSPGEKTAKRPMTAAAAPLSPAAAPLSPLTPDPDRFAWPLRGEILRRFGSSKPFPCKGVEIATPVGTPVLAAAAGRVIYSGDGIRSFGNMIILKHDDEFYTVYAFNRKNLAAAGNFVSKGERIALSGAPPGGEQPRLYFEIRRRKEPVDPTFYLPSAK